MSQETPTWAKVALWGLVLFGMAVLGTLGQHLGELFERPKRFTTEETAESAASMANSAFPPGTALNEDLISEGAAAHGDHVVYSYRFEFPQERVSPEWIDEMSSTLPSAYCQKMAALPEAGVSAEWRYLDSEGRLVLSIRSDPKECKSN